MAKWTIEQNTQKPKRFHDIKCITCDRILFSKSSCREHMGHNVIYIDKDGKPDES